jgi:hypothetical protein
MEKPAKNWETSRLMLEMKGFCRPDGGGGVQGG